MIRFGTMTLNTDGSAEFIVSGAFSVGFKRQEDFSRFVAHNHVQILDVVDASTANVRLVTPVEVVYFPKA